MRMYDLVRSKPGGYAAAGFDVTFVTGGLTYTTQFWADADLWVTPRGETFAEFRRHEGAYQAWDHAVATAVQKMANGG